jgi:DNA polymerase-3 subunit delta
LVAYLGDPLPTTDLVLVGGGGRLPKALTDAVKAAGGEIVNTVPPTRARERGGWFEDQVIAAGLRMDHQALALLASWLGEDAGRVQGILETLASTYGDARTLKVVDVEPFLGDAGGVPPWDLTDAIDRGDTTKSLLLLHRMMRAGERHPLQIMAILHTQYTKLLTLDGANAHDESSAAAVLGIKPGFPAKKALDQYRKLGNAGVVRAIGLLAQADLDLRGAKEWPDELVMEVLVARLSRLAAPGRR